MKFIKLFEYFDEEMKKKPEMKKRPDKKEIKRCIGKCDRKFFIKDDNPVIYCPSCDRILNSGI